LPSRLGLLSILVFAAVAVDVGWIELVRWRALL
jgi:hypothetical protein